MTRVQCEGTGPTVCQPPPERPLGPGCWRRGGQAAGPLQRGRGVGVVSVCGVNGCVCMRTCQQVSAGMDGQERSFQDPSCQVSSQNLPCFSLSMW